MDTIISDLEKGLNEQLSSLVENIREQEEQMRRNKEGYLKVQGALEIIGVLKQKQIEQANQEAKEELTVEGVD